MSPLDAVNGVRRNLLAHIGFSVGCLVSRARGRGDSAGLSHSTHNSPLPVPKCPLPVGNPGLSLYLSGRNGIFGCRDRAAKNRPETAKTRGRPKRVKNGRGNPPKDGLPGPDSSQRIFQLVAKRLELARLQRRFPDTAWKQLDLHAVDDQVLALFLLRKNVVPVSILSNNDDLACTDVPAPVPILVRQERNFRMQRQGRENHDQRRRKPKETKTGQDRSRKSPQKWPTWTRLAKPWFGRTGWWRPSGPNCLLPTQSSKPVSETGVRNGIFWRGDRAAKHANSA